MSIIEVANQRDEIIKIQYIVYCPICDEKQYSPFDKLFTKAYEKCVDCTDAEELELLGENIFALL